MTESTRARSATIGSRGSTITTLGMGGDYNNNSTPQKEVIRFSLPMLERAVKSVCDIIPHRQDETFTAVDYGCSHGGNSLIPMSVIIDTVRKNTSSSQPMAIYHTDVPRNDYNALFRTIHESPASYLKAFPDGGPIFTYACATSFFEQILPTNSVKLGFCSTSTHFLTDFPAEGVCLLPFAGPEPYRSIWKIQAEYDWECFLSARAKELAPGGSLVLVNQFTNELGNYSCQGIDAVSDSVMAEMVEKKKYLTPEMARHFTLPFYFRKREDFITPLSKFGLVLREEYTRNIPDPIYERYEKTGDWKGYGQATANWGRMFLHYALINALAESDKKDEAMEFFFTRFAEILTENPQKTIAYTVLYLHIEKVGNSEA